jgi:hypothetical protein
MRSRRKIDHSNAPLLDALHEYHSPTPYDTCAEISAIAEICHERGRPLIVDEAWGAHLPFHDQLPTWAMDAGADICVVSVHKMGAGFEQGSVLHRQGDRIDFPHLSACADLLMTTSSQRPALRGDRPHTACSRRCARSSTLPASSPGPRRSRSPILPISSSKPSTGPATRSSAHSRTSRPPTQWAESPPNRSLPTHQASRSSSPASGSLRRSSITSSPASKPV